MEIKKLYKYTRPDGGTSTSPVQPDGEYVEMVRLVADEGKVLTKNNIEFYACVDTDSSEGWYEVDDTQSDLNSDPDGQISDDELIAMLEEVL